MLVDTGGETGGLGGEVYTPRRPLLPSLLISQPYCGQHVIKPANPTPITRMSSNCGKPLKPCCRIDSTNVDMEALLDCPCNRLQDLGTVFELGCASNEKHAAVWRNIIPTVLRNKGFDPPVAQVSKAVPTGQRLPVAAQHVRHSHKQRLILCNQFRRNRRTKPASLKPPKAPLSMA